jgi:response regulator RpfG family c-di-GMP phosphodiesterase
MDSTDDEFLEWLDEDDAVPASAESALPPWKVLIVDDDLSVHDVTRLELARFQFQGRSVELISGYSGREARELVAAHPDAAMILLDVVMEDQHAGLLVVRHIREVLKNQRIRIVLRTGQPGTAPEHTIISEYDIHDYKEKTELTSRKMVTLMHSCLRTYRDICVIEENKVGLEQIIEASADLFRSQSLDQLTSGVLQQLNTLLNLRGAFFARAGPGDESGLSGALGLMRPDNAIYVVAGTGVFSDTVGQDAMALLPADALKALDRAISDGDGQYWDDKYLGVFHGLEKVERVVYLTGVKPLSDFDRHLIKLFSRNAGISFQNLSLRDEVEDTQRELLYRLGEAVETRSKETGGHVRRVAEMSRRLGLLSGMSEREASLLKHASPMHDVGKIGIPESILNKPGSLSSEEWVVMKRHTMIGHDLLHGSERSILQLGAVIAKEHHEKWDGSGYPDGTEGEQISLAARITAVVDVLDALLSPRCYKSAWALEDVMRVLKEGAGKHFDPRLVSLLVAHLPEFLAIRQEYPD